MKKIIVLYSANYNFKTKMLYNMDCLVEKCSVEYWNLSKITWNEHLSPENNKLLLQKEISSYDELDTLIRSNVQYDPLYATVICLDSFTWRLFYLLKKYSCRLCWLTTGPFPEVNYSLKSYSLSYNSLKIKFLTQLIKVFRMSPFCKSADYVMSCADKAGCYCKTDGKTIFVDSNSGDYQNYLQLISSESEPLVADDYIVFLDQYLPFHNDNAIVGVRNFLDPEKYYKKLNEKFKQIEESCDCRIVIAAHPSAMKYKEDDYFEGRKVFYGVTPLLVKDCKGVIIHYTTAVSFAVLFKKPIVIFMPDTADGAYHMETEVISQELGLEIYSLDLEKPFEIKELDDMHYYSYKRNYLAKDSKGTISNSDILVRLLENKYDKYD